MSNDTIDKLIWALVYGGLLSFCLSLFVGRSDAGFGGLLAAGGIAEAVLGALLIWLRSRRGP